MDTSAATGGSIRRGVVITKESTYTATMDDVAASDLYEALDDLLRATQNMPGDGEKWARVKEFKDQLYATIREG